jgi:hypothetical protein
MIMAAQCLNACRRNGIAPTRFLLTVNVQDQVVSLLEKPAASRRLRGGYEFIKKFRCSTSRFGIGQEGGSNRTPLGLHRIAEKIGGGWPAGTVFQSRQFIGYTWRGLPEAKITTRILWLEGLEPNFNRGGRVDSHRRYIYIHGTGDEPGIGRPASCGCIQMAADDLIPLFDQVPGGTLVWIAAR